MQCGPSADLGQTKIDFVKKMDFTHLQFAPPYPILTGVKFGGGYLDYVFKIFHESFCNIIRKEGPLSHGLKKHENVLISKSKSSMLNNNLKAKKCEWK